MIDNTRLRPPKVTENNEKKRIHNTKANDREQLTTQDWTHKGDRELMRKKDRQQNKNQWQRVTDNTRLRPQEWQKKNEKKGLTEQKSMTESDWQHKIETTKVTEN